MWHLIRVYACILFAHQFLDKSAGSKMFLFQFSHKYCKERSCPNIKGKYSIPVFLKKKKKKGGGGGGIGTLL